MGLMDELDMGSYPDGNMKTFKKKLAEVHANDSIVFSCAGFYGDILQLKRLLEGRLHKHRFDYRGVMTIDLCAELLSRNLYYRLFFSYYTGAILPVLMSYDPIGCIEHIAYTASGSAEPMIMPFFDYRVDRILHRLCLFPCFLSSHHTPHIALVTMSGDVEKPLLIIERATSLIKDAFCVAAEREISTRDKIHLINGKFCRR
ncbi:unnamed protein product [Brugia pahangi]|uniref:Proteasome component C10-II n=1 Tax=Brugia pahangi TaxID=6280 RepID=A0A0N4T4H6_BRUPA|nr:unnamed protein product [Brugia pahangi]